ncbi:hypothetical protein DGG96_15270 [Legionella qingyii]|uniref:Uncharacterized protein n=1 Tax=Legionella qingyii TaxID=2184757 RepID=A0A317U1R7_9GAMM|nr:hypothetical protein DGG96_15270 [Legionella qingyii]
MVIWLLSYNIELFLLHLIDVVYCFFSYNYLLLIAILFVTINLLSNFLPTKLNSMGGLTIIEC